MPRNNDIESHLQNLQELKVLNLNVTLESLLKGGAVAGVDPWDIWCGNGWILRRRPGAGMAIDPEVLRGVVREELAKLAQVKPG